MCDELINLEFAVHIVLHEAGELCPPLDAAKGTAFPDTAGDELECCYTISVKAQIRR